MPIPGTLYPLVFSFLNSLCRWIHNIHHHSFFCEQAKVLCVICIRRKRIPSTMTDEVTKRERGRWQGCHVQPEKKRKTAPTVLGSYLQICPSPTAESFHTSIFSAILRQTSLTICAERSNILAFLSFHTD